jgi:hypothetical protein
VEHACVQINADWFTSIQRDDCQITVIRQGSPARYKLSLQQFIVQTAIFSKDLALHLVSDEKKRVFPIRVLKMLARADLEFLEPHPRVLCCIVDLH